MKSVFINGAYGTVGRWVFEVYKSLGWDVITSKRKADRKILAQYNGEDLYTVPSGDSPLEFQKLGILPKGSLEDLINNFNANIIIDCTGVGAKYYIDTYKRMNVPVLFQGGEPSSVGRDFVAVPNTIGENVEDYFNKSARQVSCNTTSLSILTSSIACSVGYEHIKNMDVTLLRRCADPHEANKGIIDGLEWDVSSHHKKDLESVMPYLKGKIQTTPFLCGMTHFHTSKVVYTMDNYSIDEISSAMKNNIQCVFLDSQKLSTTSIKRAGDLLGLPGYNTILPIVQIAKVSDNLLHSIVVVPQQSIVAVSNGVWGLLMSQEYSTLAGAVNRVHLKFKVNGMNMIKLKKSLESIL